MTGTTYCEPMELEERTRASCDFPELVRGCDRLLLEEMTPLVRRQNVTLDLKSVERIDAAGIATLIRLYLLAHEAGHDFKVTNASAHVAEILLLVGLDRMFASHNANTNSSFGPALKQSAA